MRESSIPEETQTLFVVPSYVAGNTTDILLRNNSDSPDAEPHVRLTPTKPNEHDRVNVFERDQKGVRHLVGTALVVRAGVEVEAGTNPAPATRLDVARGLLDALGISR